MGRSYNVKCFRNEEKEVIHLNLFGHRISFVDRYHDSPALIVRFFIRWWDFFTKIYTWNSLLNPDYQAKAVEININSSTA